METDGIERELPLSVVLFEGGVRLKCTVDDGSECPSGPWSVFDAHPQFMPEALTRALAHVRAHVEGFTLPIDYVGTWDRSPR